MAARRLLFGTTSTSSKGPGSVTWSESSANLYGAVRSNRAYGINLKWESPDVVIVEYMDARETKQEVPSILLSGRTCASDTPHGVVGEKASAGGMLHNLRGRT